MRLIQVTILGLALSLLSAKVPLSREIESRFLDRSYKDQHGFTLPYRLMVPEHPVKGQTYPLVLFLHGSDERGTDNWKQLYVGLHIFADPARIGKNPCFIVAPQCPKGMMWADVDWKSDRHTMKSDPTPALGASWDLIHSLIDALPIDRERIYITGYSMGGFGAWDAAQRWPDFFAAIVPVCGGGDELSAERIIHTPLWAFHGARDTIVNVTRSRRMIDAIVRAGGVPRYTEYRDIDHFSWGWVYADPAMHDWLFAQRRP